MLRELAIKNFAIIDDLKISFSEGLTVLSGETGAGKSIIINAVNLLLGARASADLIRSGSQTAELEALFDIAPESVVAGIMQEHDFDTAEGLLIRRIVARNNRHKIFINGHLGTAGMLNAITENLASISGQRAHQGLLKEEQHLLILDQFGGLIPLRNKVTACFQEILPLINNLRELRNTKERQTEHLQLLEFQQKEITAAGVSVGEDIALEQERMRLKNAEELYQTVYDSLEELYNTQGAVSERLAAIKNSLDRACRIDAGLSSKTAGLAEAVFQIEDIARELRAYLQNVRIDEHRLEEVEERLDGLNKLKRKYGGSLEAVVSTMQTIEDKLADVENIDAKITATQQKILKLHGRLVELAVELSQKRKRAAEALAQKVVQKLGDLEMSKTKFEVSFQTLYVDDHTDPNLKYQDSAINESGFDRAVFLIAPNVGEPLKPLSSIVSGGELSRVVLALKAILAETESVETIVFDEVDAGIGGKVAEVVGRMLANLARHHQIICITHLPQIAKFGKHHFSISKQVSKGRTKTVIQLLKADQRVHEIARMLGGEKITQATLDHASEMLKL